MAKRRHVHMDNAVAFQGIDTGWTHAMGTGWP
jgi:hypothetical protein